LISPQLARAGQGHCKLTKEFENAVGSVGKEKEDYLPQFL
jgi:hypothetical protein